jgi:hypothetical protein
MLTVALTLTGLRLGLVLEGQRRVDKTMNGRTESISRIRVKLRVEERVRIGGVELVWEQCAGGAVGETFSGSKVGSVGSYVGVFFPLYFLLLICPLSSNQRDGGGFGMADSCG